MAIIESAQYNCEFLPDIILLTLSYYHRGTEEFLSFLYSLSSHLLVKVLTISPPLLEGGCSESWDAFRFFFKNHTGT